MNSRSVDLIYLDPPFNSNKNYAAPIGSEAAGAAFKDTWTLDDVDLAWHGQIAEQHPALYAIIDAAGLAHGSGMKSYLIMMAVRLLEMKRLLKPTGSIYLHCDPTASHYLKMTMDTVFGDDCFRNEIVWGYRGMPSKARKWQSKHDIILFYSRTDDNTFNVLRGEPTPESKRTYESARRRGYNANHQRMMVTVFDREKYEQAVQDGKIPDGMRETEFKEGRPPLRDWWEDIKILGGPGNRERIGYPTQKPLKLLERIIEASSNPGDMVLDPFCGCATACVAAQKLGRQWVGIDISDKAAELVNLRLQNEIGLEWNRLGVHRTDIPQRTDLGSIPPYNVRDNKQMLFGRQQGRCNGCRTVFPYQNFTIDHVVPQSKGGSDHIDNLQLLCNFCNSTKGAGSQEELIAKLQQQGLLTA